MSALREVRLVLEHGKGVAYRFDPAEGFCRSLTDGDDVWFPMPNMNEVNVRALLDLIEQPYEATR